MTRPNSPLTALQGRCCATRRGMLGAGFALVASCIVARPGRAAASGLRSLAFRHTHTGESLTLAYANSHAYLDGALERINWFLRDFRTGESRPIDPRLLDQLHSVATATGTRAPFEVISGYRSPATNHALQQRGGGGVASRSLHLEGRAIDVRLPDIALADVRDAAASLRAGGVGFYPQSQFVHLDTGRARRW